MAVVYQHRRRDTNEVFYVGIGHSVNRAYKLNSRNRHWINIVDKVGWSVDILFEGITWENACEVEKGMITAYGRRDLGTGQLVNMTDGGDGTSGIVRSEEWKQARREEKKGNKYGLGFKHSKEARALMSKAKVGANNPSKKVEVVEKAKKTRRENPFKYTEEILKKMRGPRGPQKQLTCPYCNKTGGATGIKQWHFENCKYLSI